jgi:bacillithiol synthase
VRFLGWLEDEQPDPGAPKEPAGRPAHSGRIGSATPRPTSTGLALDDVRAAARERLRHPGTLSAAAGREILHWNLVRGADPAVEPAWTALLRGEGVAVVTGQQPALLGGPLYTLYKLLSAVELAAELERSLGCPALAVFWVVGDDTDFGEVSSTWLPGADGSVRRLRDDAAPPGGTMIGMLPAARQLAVLDAAVSPGASAAGPGAGGDLPSARAPALGDSTAGPEARGRDLVASAAAVGGNWSGLLAALAFRLLPGVPCLFIDGAHPAVVREQSPWIREAVRAWPLRELLRAGEVEARARGFEPALEPDLGDRAAFHLAGGRRDPGTGDFGEAALLGPNVVLRPLLQDLLLPNAATICGPSEVRYRAQLGPLYRHAGIPQPLLAPRLRAVLLPPGRSNREDGTATGTAADAPAGEEMFPPEAFRDPDTYLARRTEETAPADLLARVEMLRSRTRDGLAAFGADLATYDPALPQLAESAAGKIDYQLQRLREGILARARQKLLRGDPRLARWREFVRPRDGEQERSLSLLTPFLLGGVGAVDGLREAAREQLRRLEEGRPAAAAIFALPAGAGERRTG